MPLSPEEERILREIEEQLQLQSAPDEWTADELDKIRELRRLVDLRQRLMEAHIASLADPPPPEKNFLILVLVLYVLFWLVLFLAALWGKVL